MTDNNYQIISERDEIFYIKELTTENIIHVTNNRRDAGQLVKKIKSGYSFNGWTPTFFTKSFADQLGIA